MKSNLLRGNFSSAHVAPTLEQLILWKEQGFTDIALFGRLQPPHRGHRALLETLRHSGLTVNLVLNDKTDSVEGDRNPFNPQQRDEMVRIAMPWFPAENIRHAQVYLGAGGDVGNAVRRLTAIFNSIAPPDKLVFAYFEKAEDRKEYLVDGETIKNAHYVELVGQPRGEFPIQRITQEMIADVSEYLPIDAKMFRKGIREQDEVCYELLDAPVAEYIREQMKLAERNGRLIGADPSGDTFTLEDLRRERGGSVTQDVSALVPILEGAGL
ncbi:MAG: hypothetical protein H6861_04610 [Rhodospirillales bacterium]|nr:hypothetical protein [Rhodospirillales bacterium]